MMEYGTEDGYGLVGYYVDPLTETEELIFPIFYLVARHTILSCLVCWQMWAYENRN